MWLLIKAYFIFLACLLNTMFVGSCQTTNQSSPITKSEELQEYLKGEWIARGRPNGRQLQEVLRLTFEQEGTIEIEYFLAVHDRYQTLRYSIISDDGILIEGYKGIIGIQKFSDNEFKFVRVNSSIPGTKAFDETLFIYNFERKKS